ncbi:hypothetical protein GH714_018662 [Hevea brasiliensis]|uniref:TPX2 central domain-containing protein n=1 Tax=Hevea brasiliensis TaxID=3981 RepID=A0A6A6M2H7_HEVBR|nr:hypothetical protein GH714_018662 [Hevea brasiliensis]
MCLIWKSETPLILLGRPFLKTARAKVYTFDGIVSLELDGEICKFNIYDDMKYPSDDNSVCHLEVIDYCVHDVIDFATNDHLNLSLMYGIYPKNVKILNDIFVINAELKETLEDLVLAPQRKSQLTLTIPKELELETGQCVCSVNVKSTAEFEEEIMAKIPKFKARPLNKKILEAPTLPALLRSNPQPPELQNNQRKPHLTEPKTSLLHITLRARPPMVKSSLELEKEELEKIPKFKARPLNMKIFESKGEMGIFCNVRKQVTIPQEFHIAINERIPPSVAVADVFDKNLAMTIQF